MKEIEVKAKVTNRPALLDALAKLHIQLSDPIEQNDIVFAERLDNFDQFLPGVNFLRLRNQHGKYLLTLKKSELNETESIEHETEVSNPEEVKLLLGELGFKEAVRINKKRQKAKYKDFEICVDEVAELGSYIELEKLVPEGDTIAIQTELFNFLKQLGITDTDRVELGYDTLMFVHNKKLK